MIVQDISPAFKGWRWALLIDIIKLTFTGTSLNWKGISLDILGIFEIKTSIQISQQYYRIASFHALVMWNHPKWV